MTKLILVMDALFAIGALAFAYSAEAASPGQQRVFGYAGPLSPIAAGFNIPNTAGETQLHMEVSTLLATNKYDELDKKMNGLQRAYENGSLSDLNLMHIFRVFYNINPILEEKYDKWVVLYPKSYAARMARGIYQLHLAMAARGTDVIGHVAGNQLTAMDAHLRQAWIDYKIAEGLTSKPIVTYYAMASAGQFEGLHKLEQAILTKANHIDGTNFIVRYKYMETLTTRWGGSLQQMVEFRNQVKNDGLPPEQVHLFDEAISDEVKWLAQHSKD
jgi:hypothetical protein